MNRHPWPESWLRVPVTGVVAFAVVIAGTWLIGVMFHDVDMSMSLGLGAMSAGGVMVHERRAVIAARRRAARLAANEAPGRR